MAQLYRNQYVPLIDITRGKGVPASGEGDNAVAAKPYDWKPIRLSTQFELGYNANTDTKSYICYKQDFTVLTSYSPELPQETALDSSEPIYRFMYQLARELPVGSSAEIPVMIAYPQVAEDGTVATDAADADVYDQALITLDTLNTVDGTLSWNMSLNGDPKQGTVTGLGTEEVTFVPKA